MTYRNNKVNDYLIYQLKFRDRNNINMLHFHLNYTACVQSYGVTVQSKTKQGLMASEFKDAGYRLNRCLPSSHCYILGMMINDP